MNTREIEIIQAIEIIKDYCTEVNQEQWEEIVKVADEVGLECVIGRESRKGMITPDKFVRYNTLAGVLGVYPHKHRHHEPIPFPDFLAKLKGTGEWQPKAGEMVEVSEEGHVWREAEFVAKSHGKNVVWTGGTHIQAWAKIKPLRPTITREDAEKELNKRIID